MARKSDGSQYSSVGGGRVADSDKGTVYSPNQIDQMKALSDDNRDISGNGVISFLVTVVEGIFSFFVSIVSGTFSLLVSLFKK